MTLVVTPPPNPGNPDREHLQLLAVFHFVLAGFTALAACLPLIHLGVGLFMLLKPEAFDRSPPPPFLAWFFILFAGAFILAGWFLALLLVLGGLSLLRRRHLLLCQIVAALACLMMPWGTVLGVFTLVVLSRPSVKQLFQQ